MKEGFLHNKIKEAQDKIKNINTDIEFIKEKLKKIDETEERAMKTFHKCFDELHERKIPEVVKDSVETCFNQTGQERYNQLRDIIIHEVNIMKNGNKHYITKFINEIKKVRKENSMLLSILLSKGVLSEEELKKYTRHMDKQFTDMDTRIEKEFTMTIGDATKFMEGRKK